MNAPQLRLLIVDDSNIIRSRIARIVGNAWPGMQIIGLARNGVQAVTLCHQHYPDVVTLDLTMPEMDGIQCVKELIGIRPDIRILVVSALSDKATALQAIKNGANGFLYKPFTDEQLLDALRELMA
ncbi:response regulator [Halothiobacillus sp. DCM-1]|uniref:response regulator n=1 Tax=Halothiobacillus sp. DCM-1 TaxID=3112558 RepID=UPI003253406A